jgi:hypothetical protein
VSTKEIRTTTPDAVSACDVCGRTLLKGERAHPYLDGGEHRTVCELCTSRAVQEGWIREGTVPSYDGRSSGSDRRRSLLGRLRSRREVPAPTATDEPAEHPRPVPERPRRRPIEPRHVRAVPTGTGQRMAAAVEAFNTSEHPRTIAGVARSLGLPTVAVRPAEQRPSQVAIVVAWELCWYRYDVDLAEADGAVRIASQGNELDELEPGELQPNARSDDSGLLSLAG